MIRVCTRSVSICYSKSIYDGVLRFAAVEIKPTAIIFAVDHTHRRIAFRLQQDGFAVEIKVFVSVPRIGSDRNKNRITGTAVIDC